MESFLSMKQKLLPLGLYELDDNDETVWELKAYAEGLNTLFDTLDELEREYFISTAQSYGLSRRELLFGREMSGQTAQERRDALMYLERTIVGDTTDSGFAEFLENLGLSGQGGVHHKYRGSKDRRRKGFDRRAYQSRGAAVHELYDQFYRLRIF